MLKSGRTKNKSEENNKNEYFLWSDDKVELLVNVAIKFQASKSIENIDKSHDYHDVLVFEKLPFKNIVHPH